MAPDAVNYYVPFDCVHLLLMKGAFFSNKGGFTPKSEKKILPLYLHRVIL